MYIQRRKLIRNNKKFKTIDLHSHIKIYDKSEIIQGIITMAYTAYLHLYKFL